MATQITYEDQVDYYNKLSVDIRTAENIEGEDAKVIYEALDTIAQTLKKYYKPTAEKEEQ